MVRFSESPTGPDRRPLVVDGEGEVDVVATVSGLRGVPRTTPILLEERYRNVQDGVSLLLRLRMETGLEASRCPVYVRLANPVERHVRRHPKFAVLCSDGVALLQGDQEPGDVEAPTTLTEPALLRVLEGLPIRPGGDRSRHDLANRWGPVRLWGGLQRLRPPKDVVPNPEWVGRIDRELRSEEPYAYLLALASLRGGAGAESGRAAESCSAWRSFAAGQGGRPLRVLLLDDEIDRGWGDAVTAALAVPGRVEVDVTLGGVDFDEHAATVRDKVLGEKWNLVLADLRTTADDRAAGAARGAGRYGGAEWVRQVKRARPDTAVVAFTASNKAWTVLELRALGADGHWTKESPEFGVDDEYSRDNAAALLDVVRAALERRVAARPVWDLVARLQALAGAPPHEVADDWERAVLNSETTDYVRGWASALGHPPDHVKRRLSAIVGRLRRAYGLLVADRSPHAETAFALRREDLAYLAAWGVGNEVRQLYFDGPDHDPKRQLWELPSATFTVRDPSTGRPLVYWETAGRREVVEPDEVPEYLVKDLCPVDGVKRPCWPSLGADNSKVEWLLERAGRNDLADRFAGTGAHQYNGLRYLRNHLEDTHGQLQAKAGGLKGPLHAEADDVADLCGVWEALLVDPYA